MSEYLTPDEVANLLRCNRKTIYAAIRDGRLPALEIGRSLRVHRDDLQRLAASRADRSSSGTGAPGARRPVSEFAQRAKGV